MKPYEVLSGHTPFHVRPVLQLVRVVFGSQGIEILVLQIIINIQLVYIASELLLSVNLATDVIISFHLVAGIVCNSLLCLSVQF